MQANDTLGLGNDWNFDRCGLIRHDRRVLDPRESHYNYTTVDDGNTTTTNNKTNATHTNTHTTATSTTPQRGTNYRNQTTPGVRFDAWTSG